MGVKHLCTLVALLLATSLATGIPTDANAKRKTPEPTEQATDTLIYGNTPKQLCETSKQYVVDDNKLYIIGRYSHEGQFEDKEEVNRITNYASKNAWEIVDYLTNEASLGTSQIRQDLRGTYEEIFSSSLVGGTRREPTYSSCVVLEIDPNRKEHNETAQQLVTMALDLSD
jgi:hypothetical protein